MHIETINVKPWGQGQGDFVVINKADFDPELHEAFEPDSQQAEQPASPAKRGRKAKAEAADEPDSQQAGE